MGPKKGKKGKVNAKDDDWGDDSEKQLEEKMKNLMSADNGGSNEDIPVTKSKGNKKKKNKVKGEFYMRQFTQASNSALSYLTPDGPPSPNFLWL